MRPLRLAIVGIALAVGVFAAPEARAQVTWSGTSADWNVAGNWTSGTGAGVPAFTTTNTSNILFGTGSVLTSTNTISSGTFRNLTFLNSGWTLRGNAMAMTGTISNNFASGTNVIGLDLNFAGATPVITSASVAPTMNPVTVFTGNLSMAANKTLNLATPGNTLTGTHWWVFAGSNSFTSGTISFSSGQTKVLALNSSGALGGATFVNNASTSFANTSGTAVTVDGNFAIQAGSNNNMQLDSPLTTTGTLIAAVTGTQNIVLRGSQPFFGVGSIAATPGGFFFLTSGTNAANPLSGTFAINGASNFASTFRLAGNLSPTLMLGNTGALGSGTLAVAAISAGNGPTLTASSDLSGGLPNSITFDANGSYPTRLNVAGANSIRFTGASYNLNGNDGSRLTNNLTNGAVFTLATGSVGLSAVAATGTFVFEGTGMTQIDSPIVDAIGGSGTGSLVKRDTGSLKLTNTNSYSGSTILQGGLLRLDNANALPGGIAATGGSGNLAISGSGVLGLGAGNTDFQRSLGTGATQVQIAAGGFAAFGSGTTRTVNLGGGTPAAVTWGVNNFMTTAGGTFALGHATSDATVDFQNPVVLNTTATGVTRTINVARGSASVDAILSGVLSQASTGSSNVVIVGGGVLSLKNASNSFSGKPQISDGTVQIAALTDSDQNSPLGTNATIDLGSGATAGGLRWVGTTSATSNRVLNLAGTTGNATLDASGQGALVLTAANTATGAGSKTLFLAGTSTAANELSGAIVDSGGGSTSVTKTGSGAWRLSGNNTFTGQVAITQGTLVAGHASALGAGSVALVGGTDSGLGGSAALLLAGTTSLNRALEVTQLGGGGASQRVILGGTNTSGTTSFGSAMIRVGRDLTLQAATNGAVRFGSNWVGSSGSGSLPANSITFGSAGNTGTVIVSNSIALTSGSMRVAAGTLSLAGQIVRPATGQPLYLATTTQLAGSGTVAGTITGEGLVAPGNSPGILVADAVNGADGLDWAFEFTSLGSPNYGATGASVLNDVLRLTGTSPFSNFLLSTSNTVSVYFTMGSLSAGNVVRGGFFTDNAADFLTTVSGATYRYFVMGSGSGTDTTYNGQGYYTLANYNSNLAVTPTTVAETGTFAGASVVAGRVMQFTIGNTTVGTTYTLSATASPAAIRVGQTTTVTTNVVNTGTGTSDGLTVGTLGVNTSGPVSGTIPINMTGVNSAASGGGLVSGTGGFSSLVPGSYTFTPYATATNSTLNTQATSSGTSSGGAVVYNPASATVNTASPVTLGRVIVGGAFGTQAVSITNSGTAADPYQESLNATVTGSSGGASWSGSVTNLFTTSTSISVGLGGASTATAGVRSGTVTLAFVSTGTSSAGATGLSPLPLGTQDLAVSGTVLAHSTPSLDPVSQLVEQTLSLGTWDYELGQWIVQTGTSAFSFWNVASEAPATLTAGLEVTGTSYTGNSRFTTTFSLGSSSLIAAGTSATYAALFNTAGLATSGTYTGTFTFLTADQNLPGSTAGSPLAVRVNVIVVPEPETVVFAGIGIAMLGWTMWKRRRIAAITRDR